jgi:peptidoglycan/LPS O-acetylase OafA/YrhL
MHIIGIDRLRAFAALSVLFAHVVGPHLPGVLRYAFTGHPAVVAFFVISGFCIHRPYVARPLPVMAFWASRALRILPPAFAALLLAKRLGIEPFNFTDGYILWSVACELWYYALYPAFLVASRIVPWSVLVAVSAAGWLVLVLTLGTDQYGNATVYGPWLNWIVGLLSWLMGCALAERKHFSAPLLPIGIWRVCVAFSASVLYWATLNTSYGFYLTMNPFGLLVTLWISAEIGLADRDKAWGWIGRWSFSIYLFHAIAWTALARVGVASPLLLVPAILALCYVAARAIERPSHRAARAAFIKLTPTRHVLIDRPNIVTSANSP